MTQTRLTDTPHGPLAVRTFGSGPPFVALHGFTHTGSQFAPLAELVGRTIHAPDLPGHGRSRVAPVTLEATLEAIAALQGELGPTPLLGYSQGGRLALLLALGKPELVSSVIALSASPGVADRTARRTSDEAIAASLEANGLETFLDEWLSAPMTGTSHLPAAVRTSDRQTRAENTARGLAAALRGYGQGVQPSIASELGGMQPPCLFIAGERDRRYVALAQMMAASVPEGRVFVITGAGHNVLLDAVDEVAAVIAGSQSSPKPSS